MASKSAKGNKKMKQMAVKRNIIPPDLYKLIIPLFPMISASIFGREKIKFSPFLPIINLMKESKTLFELIGGLETLQKVHRNFYDKVFSHPWLRKYFTDFVQDLIEIQQTNFMMMVMGGPNKYDGRKIRSTHHYMFITEKLFEIRHELLKKTLEEEGLTQDLKEKWLSIDYSFKSVLVKNNMDECYSRFYTGFVMAFDEDGTNKSVHTKKKPN